MNIKLKGKKTFMQSFNPMCIEVAEKRTNNQVVHRFYSSAENMSASDKFAYYAAARRYNSMCR